jgi:allantoin racemase
MTLRLHLVTPVTGVAPPDTAALAAGLGAGVMVTQSAIATGPASIESAFDEAIAVPPTLAEVTAAAESGAGAIVINCMGDPGLQAARELVSVPVLGPGQTSMHLASMLGHRFSILTVLDQLVSVDEEKAATYGIAGRLASVRSVGIPVLDLEGSQDKLIGALTEQGLRAVRDDGAHVLILGCTGMLGAAARLRAELAAHGVTGIPVIDPIPATLHVAAALAGSGLTHSKRTYPQPLPKARPGYAGLDAAARPAAPGD